MKFLAVLAESGAADTLSKITEFVSKLCKDKVTLRFTSDAIYFLNPCPLANNGNYLQIKLNVAEFFSTYVMGGISEDFNEIYMDVEKDYFFRCMSAKDRSTKIRLVKLGNVPHLKVEQRLCGMTHELPIELIPTKYWKTYDMPTLNNIAEIKGSQEGELQFCGDLDMANIIIHFSNLTVVPLESDHESNAIDLSVLQTVRVDIRAVYLLFRSFSTLFTLSRILLRIVPEKMAVFSVEQNESSLLYFMSGMA